MAWQEVESGGAVLRYGNEGLVARAPAEVPAILKEHGVCVLLGVLTDAECAAMREGAWATATTLLPELDRADPSTYREMARLRPHHGGLIQWHRWAHAPYIWDVRSNPKVAAAHEAIHGTDDLKVSFDGINFGLGYRAFDGHHKLHIDQDFRPGSAGVFKCVQAWVTSEPVELGDATLRCYPGSHKLHKAFCDHFHLGGRKAKPDWFQLSRNHERTKYIKWYEDKQGCVDTCITCPAGAMVLWDSRTVHSGIERLPFKANSFRNLAYVCYMPSSRCQKGLKTRAAVFDPTSPLYLRTCSHWPDEMRPFDLYPPARERLPGGGFGGRKLRDDEQHDEWAWVPQLSAPTLSPRGRRLAGIDTPKITKFFGQGAAAAAAASPVDTASETEFPPLA